MIRNFSDLTSLWHDSVETMWYGKVGNGIDFVANIDTICYDNVLAAKSMAYEFDLGRDLWLNKVRWTNLLRMYLDLGETTRFLERAASIGLGEGKRGVVTQMFGSRAPDFDLLEGDEDEVDEVVSMYAKHTHKHRWGNCMGMYCYRGLRSGKPTFTMHSRVSYIAYIGGLDLALAHVLAREIGKRIDVPVEEFRFRWYVDALQFHGFKSLPMLYKQQYVEDLENLEQRKQFPTQALVGRWWDKIVADTENGKPLTEEKYGPLKRVRRRYMEWCDGQLLPSVTLDALTLAPLR